MAEDPVLGKAPIERPLECIDIVNPFANERALAKQVLVHIGHGARIRVDARFTPPEPRIPRSVRGRQAHRHPWLQDAVSLGDALLVFVVVRPIQRVRHGTDKLPRRIARQLGIRIESDDVLYAR